MTKEDHRRDAVRLVESASYALGDNPNKGLAAIAAAIIYLADQIGSLRGMANVETDDV